MHFLMNQEYDEILDFVLKEEAICWWLGVLEQKGQNAFEIGIFKGKSL